VNTVFILTFDVLCCAVTNDLYSVGLQHTQVQQTSQKRAWIIRIRLNILN
jgi:hypothetical protein